MSVEDALRQHVLDELRRTVGRRFEGAVADFPVAFMNVPAPNVDYTPWGLVEHLRISQYDILEYIRNPSYVSPKHPDGYWPSPDQKADQATWDRSLAAFRADSKTLEELIADPKTDLLLPMPHTPGHTILREISLVVGHSSYHLGEFGILRQVMGTWPPGHV
jgi:hypothetical protein